MSSKLAVYHSNYVQFIQVGLCHALDSCVCLTAFLIVLELRDKVVSFSLVKSGQLFVPS